MLISHIAMYIEIALNVKWMCMRLFYSFYQKMSQTALPILVQIAHTQWEQHERHNSKVASAQMIQVAIKKKNNNKWHWKKCRGWCDRVERVKVKRINNTKAAIRMRWAVTAFYAHTFTHSHKKKRASNRNKKKKNNKQSTSEKKKHNGTSISRVISEYFSLYSLYRRR